MAGQEGIKPLKLLFTLLSVILLSALTVFSIALWDDVKTSQYDKLYKQNQTLISQSRSFFDHQTRLIVKTVQARFIDKKLQKRSVSNVFEYLLSATGEAAVFSLIDIKGKVLLSKGDINPPQLPSQNTVLENLKVSQTAQIGYLHRAGLLGESLLPFYVPILNKDKKIIAVVVAFYRVQGKSSLMQNFISPDNNTIWLLGELGQVRMSYPVPKGFVSDLFGWRLAQETASEIQYNLQSGKTKQGLELEVKGEQVLANVGYLPEYKLITLNSYPVAKLFSSWLERMRPIGIVFVLFLLAALLAYRVSLQISKRMSDAKQTAEGNVQKLSKAIEQSPDSVVITDNLWSIEYANSHFDLATAKPNAHDEARGHNIIDFPPYNVLTRDLKKISDEISLKGSWFGERKTDFDGKWYSFSISHITNPDDELTHYVVVVQDISSRKQAEAKLYKQANFDPLTGLPNRRRTNENLTRELQNAWKSKQQVAVLYLDIDNFKTVNDTFGHMIGDQLLQLVAGRLVKCCKGKAQICHISGDEFLVYATYDKIPEVESLADKILRNVEKPVLIEGKQIFISVSIGISCYPEDNNEVAGLIKFADIALFESKKDGRNRYSFFDHELDRRLKRRHTIETELRQALERGEIYMAYQSKNNIDTGHIMGFEALMRWNSSVLGPVGPFEFIEIAEEIGVINELGEFALRQACLDLIELQKFSDTPLIMAVNLSIRQLNDDSVIDMVDGVIKETGIDPSRLELEITESLLAENIEKLLPRLEKLLEFGTSLTIDDFGTGYSSLSYLTTFPVSTLKVDRAFVKDMVHNQGDATLTHTIITMAHALKMKVVAEGIEDEDQLAMLRDFGCDIGQGYLFSRPLIHKEMEILVETENLPNTRALNDSLT
ncbi:putative bifunctional diguanylate cyclase/phosphodiesterase [Neptuniibacter sp. QD57_21]|uniref:putative bifunctional diguanylate cyclase/phosphodiesterase n=1 Tax=Neptuniibacter sp. QD57_21 TaxID=3398213 RepID=UPI0039F53CED